MNKIKLGKFGEKIARQYLENKGYKILETNYYTRAGEIDLICQKNRALIFIEVKTRTSSTFGYPEQAITQHKQNHLAKAVQQFLQDYPKPIQTIRIDVISIRLINQKALIKHLKNIIQDINSEEN